MKKEFNAAKAMKHLLDAMADKREKDEAKNNPPRTTELAINFLSRRNPFDNIPQSQYALMLMVFQEYKGNEAIEALAGLYIYAIDHIGGEKAGRVIETTFAHDLGQAKDKWMEPRSSSYRQYWLEEIEKRGWK